MRVLYLYCHPVEESFHGAIRTAALAGLAKAGHAVDLCDLYAEDFDPVLRREARIAYHGTAGNRTGLEGHVLRLRGAEALLVQFPTWCYGPPAMLKGWFDRVLLPGVAFSIEPGRQPKPLLQNLRRISGIVTYGRGRFGARFMGDPPKMVVTRYLPWFAAKRARVDFHPLYDMNTASQSRRERFLREVEQAMADR